mmetsp:Transcript_27399/g.63976  ORF Transcript_27399/g.63976 Transcript_27399/m.63976 type:complete len:804 (-) Transcript_27399:54-2465(-)
MNRSMVSLPDLMSGQRRQTVMSLSEGFQGGDRKQALAVSSQNVALKPNLRGIVEGEVSATASALPKVLPVYYRTRQFAFQAEKGGHRVPRKLQADLRSQEQVIKQELRPLHPLLFQRFNDQQLDRLLRAMPFYRLSVGRWIFGGDAEDDHWPSHWQDRAFIVLTGKVVLFEDSKGTGAPVEVKPGEIFGQKQFLLGDEAVRDKVGQGARVEEASIIGLLSGQVLETAFSDRAYGNKRIAQVIKEVPSLYKITGPADQRDQDIFGHDRSKSPHDKEGRAGSKMDPNSRPIHVEGLHHRHADEKESSAITAALESISRIATGLVVKVGQEILTEESLDDNVLIVAKGSLEVRSDMLLVERLESLPPRKVRIRVTVERAENLAGDSIFDKLDPYCLVKLGEHKRFQTPVLTNSGVNPRWQYTGVLTYAAEEVLEFAVMDFDKYSADDLCGSGSIAVAELYDGWKGKIQLTQPKRGIFKSESTLEVPAGVLHFSVKFDFEQANQLLVKPKQKLFPDQVVFTLKEKDTWGAEHLMLGDIFKKTLEQASKSTRFNLTFTKFRVVGASVGGIQNDTCTCWKVTRRRFSEFVSHAHREKPFLQSCRLSTLQKQLHIKDLLGKMIDRWEQETLSNKLRGAMMNEEEEESEVMDPTRFRVAYRGTRCHLIVRNALNLQGGGWFDQLDPYVIVKFRGAKADFRTSVLKDAGNDPIWDCDGALTYNGETALEIYVWDYDRLSADDLLATGVLHVEQFCNGYEGMVPLYPPEGKMKKKSVKQMLLVFGLQWETPPNLKSGTGAPQLSPMNNSMRSP